jgi:hypothetical protein
MATRSPTTDTQQRTQQNVQQNALRLLVTTAVSWGLFSPPAQALPALVATKLVANGLFRPWGVAPVRYLRCVSSRGNHRVDARR